MAQGGHKKGLSRSTQKRSRDCSDVFCEPCEVDHNQIEAAFRCSNCEENLCEMCSITHKKFKQSRDHEILDIQQVTHKPPVSKKRSKAVTKAVTTATHAKDIKMTNKPPVSKKRSKAVTTATHSKDIKMTNKPPVSKKRSKAVTKAVSNVLTTVNHVRDIKIKGSITTFALMSSNQLLVPDIENSKVILVDTDSGTQVSEIELSSKPWQVTKISDTEAAVVIPIDDDNKIIVLRTQPQLSVVREINVEGHGQCKGLAYMDNRFIVTFQYGSVCAVDMSGKLLNTIAMFGKKGKKLFTCPLYITVDPATGSIYVSDLMGLVEGELVKLSMEGIIEARYRSERGGYPNQVVLGTEGMLYVAWSGRSGSGFAGWVDQHDANCNFVRTITQDDLALPRAVSYDEATQQLCVGLMDVVKVYTLSPVKTK